MRLVQSLFSGLNSRGGGGQDRRSVGAGVFETQTIEKVIAPKKFRKPPGKIQKSTQKTRTPQPRKSKKTPQNPRNSPKQKNRRKFVQVEGEGQIWSTGGGLVIASSSTKITALVAFLEGRNLLGNLKIKKTFRHRQNRASKR